ncbi:hypothetical protein [Microbacterium terregens]|uniref:CMD domain protein n=1 Tax=Microbacterium terregens TaxID=69363 RepID=A0ABV5T5D5_9MICO
MTDVIREIAETDSDAPRAHRPAVREAAQAAYDALFVIGADDPVPGVDADLRHLVAARAAWIDRDAAATEWYLDRTAHADAAALVTDGPDGAVGVRAPRRVRAALRHVDLLVARPAASTRDDLTALTASGWSAAEVIVISQIVGFVSYQVRVAHALRVQEELALAEENA